MIEVIEVGEYEFRGDIYKLIFRKNPRTKRIGLRVNDKKQILITMRNSKLLADAKRFLSDNLAWLNKSLTKFDEAVFNEAMLVDGTEIYLVGKPYLTLRFSENVKSYLIDKENKLLLVNKDNQLVAIKKFYKKMATQIFGKRVEYFGSLLNLSYKRISIKDQSTRWGSCSNNKVLSFSWRAVIAPSEVIDYLVLHEVCHLKHMDHSVNFWGLVSSVMPNYEKYDKWLKLHGYKLKGFLN